MSDVDDLAGFIRQIDPHHTLGSGAMAEKICEYFGSAPTWTSTTDEPPEEGEYVLLYNSNFDFHCVAKRLECGNYECLEGGELLDWIPTDWQPLTTPEVKV